MTLDAKISAVRDGDLALLQEEGGGVKPLRQPLRKFFDNRATSGTLRHDWRVLCDE